MGDGGFSVDVADDIRPGLTAYPACSAVDTGDRVACACVVTEGLTGRVGDAERVAGLEASEVRDLPAAEDVVEEAGALEDGQVVDEADLDKMLLVEVGRRTGAGDVVGVEDLGADAAIGGVVEGVAVGVGEAAVQPAEVAADADLQGVVVGRGDVIGVGDAGDAEEGTEWVRAARAAGDGEVIGDVGGDGLAVDGGGVGDRGAGDADLGDAVAVRRGDDLAGGVGVIRGCDGLELIAFHAEWQMAADAADVGRPGTTV